MYNNKDQPGLPILLTVLVSQRRVEHQYVCTSMVIITMYSNKDQPTVADPDRGQLNRGNEYFPVVLIRA